MNEYLCIRCQNRQAEGGPFLPCGACLSRTKPPAFVIGDVVALKSGGLPMTVAALQPEVVEGFHTGWEIGVVWMSSDGEVGTLQVPSDTLAKVVEIKHERPEPTRIPRPGVRR